MKQQKSQDMFLWSGAHSQSPLLTYCIVLCMPGKLTKEFEEEIRCDQDEAIIRGSHAVQVFMFVRDFG